MASFDFGSNTGSNADWDDTYDESGEGDWTESGNNDSSNYDSSTINDSSNDTSNTNSAGAPAPNTGLIQPATKSVSVPEPNTQQGTAGNGGNSDPNGWPTDSPQADSTKNEFDDESSSDDEEGGLSGGAKAVIALVVIVAIVLILWLSGVFGNGSNDPDNTATNPANSGVADQSGNNGSDASQQGKNGLENGPNHNGGQGNNHNGPEGQGQGQGQENGPKDPSGKHEPSAKDPSVKESKKNPSGKTRINPETGKVEVVPESEDDDDKPVNVEETGSETSDGPKAKAKEGYWSKAKRNPGSTTVYTI